MRDSNKSLETHYFFIRMINKVLKEQHRHINTRSAEIFSTFSDLLSHLSELNPAISFSFLVGTLFLGSGKVCCAEPEKNL